MVSLVNGWVIGGAASRVAADATAVGPRPPGFEMRFIANWRPGDPDGDRHRAWARQSWARLARFGAGQYLTFLSDEDPAAVRAAYGERLARLTAVKDRWDPADFECTVIDRAAAAGVGLVVKLSGPDAAVDSPMIFERWHGEIERHLAGSGLPAVLLRPRTFLTNLLAYAGTVARTGMLFAPAGTAAIAFVDPRDVAEAAATALTEPGHAGRTYRLTGPEAITYERIAAELSAATGRPVTYVPVGDEQAREAMLAEGLPPLLADAIVAIFAAQRTGAMSGTTDAVRLLTGHSPRTMAAFAHEHAAAFRPVGATTPG